MLLLTGTVPQESLQLPLVFYKTLKRRAGGEKVGSRVEYRIPQSASRGNAPIDALLIGQDARGGRTNIDLA